MTSTSPAPPPASSTPTGCCPRTGSGPATSSSRWHPRACTPTDTRWSGRSSTRLAADWTWTLQPAGLEQAAGRGTADADADLRQGLPGPRRGLRGGDLRARHRRRAGREPGQGAARRRRRGARPGDLAARARLGAAGRARATSRRKRWSACSTWASAWWPSWRRPDADRALALLARPRRACLGRRRDDRWHRQYAASPGCIGPDVAGLSTQASASTRGRPH